MVNLSAYKFLVTLVAPKLLQTSKHLPEDVFPRRLLLSQKHHKLIDVPEFVTAMLCHYVSKRVNEYISIGTLHPVSLIVGVKSIALDTPVEHVVFFLEKIL